jgi:hypothetical protein
VLVFARREDDPAKRRHELPGLSQAIEPRTVPIGRIEVGHEQIRM